MLLLLGQNDDGVVKCIMVHRQRQVRRNSDPMITCRPWNPVAIKKVEPYTLSAILNMVSIYSVACK